MSYLRFLTDLPADIQKPMAHLLEAFQEEMRSQFVVSQEQWRGLQNLVVDLAESQRRTDERMRALFEAQEALTQSVRELTEAQRSAEARLSRLETAVAELTEAQRSAEARISRLETVVQELAAAQRRTEEALQKLILRVDRIETRLGALVGDNLERKYRERAFSYLGPVLRPVHVVSLQDLLPRLETHLTEEEMDRLLPLDLLLHGRVRHLEAKPEVWLAMEVSGVVDQHDVERAVDRARLLTKAGLPAIPTVAGEDLGEGIARLASEKHVFVLLDGQRLNWHEALAAVVGMS